MDYERIAEFSCGRVCPRGCWADNYCFVYCYYFPIVIIFLFEQSFYRLVISVIVSVLAAFTSIYIWGFTTNERIKITNKIASIIKDKLHL